MSQSYNTSSNYSRTYEKKTIEETPRVRVSSPFSGQSIIPAEMIQQEMSNLFPEIANQLADLKMTSPQFSLPSLPSMQMQTIQPGMNTTSSSAYSFGGPSGTLRTTDESFDAVLDCPHFKPEDLKVSVIGQYIVVEGRHSEKQDEMGLIERSFVRKFALPRSVRPEAVTSSLTPDGTLQVQALPPRKPELTGERTIPIKVVSTSSAAPSPQPAQAPPTQPPPTQSPPMQIPSQQAAPPTQAPPPQNAQPTHIDYAKLEGLDKDFGESN